MSPRYAEYSELPQIVKLARKGFKEVGEPTNPEDLINLVYASFAQAPCLVLEKDGGIIGFWGLCTVRPKWDRTRVNIADYMFYILPEHRSMKTVNELVKAAKDAAGRFGLPLRLNYFFSTDKADAHIRLFRKVGFDVRGVIGVFHG